MLIEMEVSENSPIIEDFLFIMDQAADKAADLSDYSEVIVSDLIADNDADIEPEEPLTADTPLPDFCEDTSAQDDFDIAALELAAQITRTNWAEAKTDLICAQL